VEEAEQELEPEEAAVSGIAAASFRSMISRPVISSALNSILFTPPDLLLDNEYKTEC